MADATVNSASTSKNTNNIKYISQNGGTVLLRGGYQYYARRKHKSGLLVWACAKRTLCSGLLRVKDETIMDETPHRCGPPDFVRNDIAESLHELKETIINPEFSNISRIYNSMLGKLKDSGLDMIAKLPNFSSFKSTLYRQRNAAAGLPKIQCKNVMEVKVPPQYENFLLADYSCDADNTCIIVFSTAEGRQVMGSVTNFYSDGTFKSCPQPFYQLYTIHGDTGSTIKYNGIIPLVYALLSSKTMKSYITLLSMIKSPVPGWNPVTFKTDYEKAAMKAISVVFPSVIIKGCYFHYNQAIFKKGRHLHMTDFKKRRMVALSAVLPLLPANEIVNGWVYINARYGNGNDDSTIKKIIEYMEKQWLHENFPRVWCVFGEPHRTANALEAWHNKLNRDIGRKNPNLMHLLHVLKDDSHQHSVQIIRRQSFMEGTSNIQCAKRTRKTIYKDELIQEVQLELTTGQITVGHFLEIMRY